MINECFSKVCVSARLTHELDSRITSHNIFRWVAMDAFQLKVIRERRKLFSLLVDGRDVDSFLIEHNRAHTWSSSSSSSAERAMPDCCFRSTCRMRALMLCFSFHIVLTRCHSSSSHFLIAVLFAAPRQNSQTSPSCALAHSNQSIFRLQLETWRCSGDEIVVMGSLFFHYTTTIRLENSREQMSFFVLLTMTNIQSYFLLRMNSLSATQKSERKVEGEVNWVTNKKEMFDQNVKRDFN